MRDVYHHFTHQQRLIQPLPSLEAGRPAWAILDFPPSKLLGRMAPVKGVPHNRGGHGILQKVLIEELTTAGFELHTIPTDWSGRGYCVVVRKPPLKPDRRYD
jgi:hypothetical protein